MVDEMISIDKSFSSLECRETMTEAVAKRRIADVKRCIRIPSNLPGMPHPWLRTLLDLRCTLLQSLFYNCFLRNTLTSLHAIYNSSHLRLQFTSTYIGTFRGALRCSLVDASRTECAPASASSVWKSEQWHL